MQKPKHEWQHLRKKNAHLGVGWRRFYFQWQVHWYLPLVKLSKFGRSFLRYIQPQKLDNMHFSGSCHKEPARIHKFIFLNIQKSILNTGSQSIKSPPYKLILHAFLLWLHNTLTSPLTWNKYQDFLGINALLLSTSLIALWNLLL